MGAPGTRGQAKGTNEARSPTCNVHCREEAIGDLCLAIEPICAVTTRCALMAPRNM
jgi:hypothetical protein